VDRFKELPVGEYRTHKEATCFGKDGPCADEVLDTMQSHVVNVTKVDCTSKEDCEGHTWETFFFKHKNGRAILKKIGANKKFVPASKLEEPSLDGMSDQMVSIKKGKVDAAQTPRWTKFYAPEMEQADKARSVASKSAFAQLEKVKGDETLDTTDNVHVDADKVGTGPHAGELQWDTFYSGKVVKGGAEAARKDSTAEAKPEMSAKAPKGKGTGAMLAGAYKDGGHLHYGMSDTSAQKDIDSFWDSLDQDPDHGDPTLA